MTVAQQIHDALPEMTAAEKKTAHVLLANYPVAGLSSVAEFAELAGTSGPTVLRFVAKLGFPSYPEFQKVLRGEIHESLLSPLDKDRTNRADTTATPSDLSRIFDRVRGKLAGCNTYLIKPVERKVFQTVVKTSLLDLPGKEVAISQAIIAQTT